MDKKARATNFLDRIYGFESYKRLLAMAGSGPIPHDIQFRLSTIGWQSQDIEDPSTGRFARSHVIHSLLGHADHDLELHPAIERIVSDPLPPVIFNERKLSRIALNEMLADGPPFIAREDLFDAISERRRNSGKELTFTQMYKDMATGKTWTEASICGGISLALWSTILKRLRPQWTTPEGIQELSRPKTFITKRGEVRINEDIADVKTARRLLLGSALIRADALLGVYQEKVTTGVRGIGTLGVQDLHTLLQEEYPSI